MGSPKYDRLFILMNASGVRDPTECVSCERVSFVGSFLEGKNAFEIRFKGRILAAMSCSWLPIHMRRIFKDAFGYPPLPCQASCAAFSALPSLTCFLISSLSRNPPASQIHRHRQLRFLAAMSTCPLLQMSHAFQGHFTHTRPTGRDHVIERLLDSRPKKLLWIKTYTWISI